MNITHFQEIREWFFYDTSSQKHSCSKESVRYVSEPAWAQSLPVRADSWGALYIQNQRIKGTLK